MGGFSEGGRGGLGDEDGGDHQIHNRAPAKWVARIGRCKRQHSHWGAPKIHWILKRRFGQRELPSEAAISRWLKRWGLTRRGRARGPRGPAILRAVLTEAREPNEVWTGDFNGWCRTED